MLQYMLEPLMPHLEGGTEDIAINEPGVAFVLRGGAWNEIEVPDFDEDTLLDMTTMAASIAGQQTGDRNPLLFCDIPMASGPELRLMAVQWPAVERGRLSWTLRQPGDKIHGLDAMPMRYATERWNRWQRRREARNHDAALALFDSGDIVGFLRHLVLNRYNIICCGRTGAGKTTAGLSLIDEIPLSERIITVENAREYRMRHKNKVHLIYSQGDVGRATVTQNQLLNACMRARPTRVLVQELLDGDAARTYVQQIVSGHPGSVTTIHGGTAAQAFKRLFNMVQTDSHLDAASVVALLSSAVDCIMPFHSENNRFEIGEVFFAPDAARRGERHADLLTEID